MFWTCVAARTVRAELESALFPLGHTAPLTRAQVWLMQPPSCVHVDLWRPACLAAIHAVELARRQSWTAGFQKRPTTTTDRAAVRTWTKTEFWRLIADYAAVGRCSDAARSSVAPPLAPFLWAAHPHRPHGLQVVHPLATNNPAADDNGAA